MSTFTSGSATVIHATFQGLATPGGISIPGLLVGDVVVSIIPSPFQPGFEQIVSVADQLQQITTENWSTMNFVVYLIRGA
jgi:hypothetical protein